MALLTEEYEKIIKTEKIKRLLFLFVALLVAVGAMGIAFMLPSYFSAAFSKDAVLERLKLSEEILAKKNFKNIEAEVNRINTLIADFEKNESRRRLLAPLLLKIANTAPFAVDLRLLTLEAKSDGAAVLTINGRASTREVFLDYFEKLKKLEEAEAVISPVTNLLRETDVVFVLELKIKKEIYSYVPEK